MELVEEASRGDGILQVDLGEYRQLVANACLEGSHENLAGLWAVIGAVGQIETKEFLKLFWELDSAQPFVVFEQKTQVFETKVTSWHEAANRLAEEVFCCLCESLTISATYPDRSNIPGPSLVGLVEAPPDEMVADDWPASVRGRAASRSARDTSG